MGIQRMMIERTLAMLGLLVAASGCSNEQGAQGTRVSSQALGESLRLPNWVESPLAPPSTEVFAKYNSVAIAGDVSLAGIPWRENQDSFSGTVIPYHQTGNHWIQEPPLISDDPDQTRTFGVAVAVSSVDALVGGSVVSTEDGAVWPFVRTASAWVASGAAIAPPANAAGGQSLFGSALALEGDTLVIGSKLADGSDSSGAVVAQGAAYVYSRTTQGWQLEETLKPTGLTTASSGFGFAVAISGDLVAVGAPDEVGDSDEPDGAVYVFQRSRQTGVWSAGQRIVAAVPTNSAYGKTVALGVTRAAPSAAPIIRLAVGAPDTEDNSGIAYEYQRTATGWSSEVRLTDPDGVGGRFGASVGFSTDKLFIAAPSANSSGSGHVQAFGLDAGLPSLGNLVLDSQPGIDETSIGVTLAVSPSSALILSAAPGVYVFAPKGGESCDSNASCSTGYCSDGVCCDTACTGTCQSCLAANKQDHTSNNGICGVVAADTDPRDDCEPGSSICGMTGVCDGSGKCSLRAAHVACADARCSTRTALVGSSSCDGTGHCAAPAAQACAEGTVCAGGACAETCTDNTECDGTRGFYCFDGACVTGTRCSADQLSVYSETGVISPCSPSLCDHGACKVQCTASLDCQPGHACEDGVCVTSCSGPTDCDMGYYCFRGVCMNTARCSGSSLFSATGDESSCGSLLCKDGACPERCSDTDDCATPNVCRNSNCVAPDPTGSDSHISSSSCSIGFHHTRSIDWLYTLGFATWLAARRRNSGKSRSRRLIE